jgi:tetratricopeptide (TPR) repeat protein
LSKRRKKGNGGSSLGSPAALRLNKKGGFPVRHVMAISLMAVLALLAYSNTFHVPFQFDDAPNISENTSVHLKSLSLEWMDQLIKRNSDSLRFFAYLTFALNYYFGGFQVFGYHLVNFLIHLSSGILLYGFLLLTLNLPSLRERYGSTAFPIALISSLFFLSHPIQTQSVTYIVQRMASMAGMFYLLAMVLYIKGRLSSGRNRFLFWAGAVLTYLLGLFTKENVAILPLFVALYEFYFFENFDLGPRGRKPLLYAVGFVFAVGLTMALVWGPRYMNVIIEGYKTRDFTLTERVLTQFRVVLHYVTLLVWPLPSRLNLDYDFPASHGILDPFTTLLSILIVVGLIGYSIVAARKRPLVSYFILWYFGNLAIESSIFPLEMVYEHRLYLPAIGPIVLFVSLGVKGWEKIEERLRLRSRKDELRPRTTDTVNKSSEFRVRSSERKALNNPDGHTPRRAGTDTIAGWAAYPLWGFFLAVTVLMVWGSYERNKVWRDPITLWQDCLKKSPKKERPYYNLGFNYYLLGRHQDALEAFKKAILLKPNDPDSYNSLGMAYKAAGFYPEAIEAYRKAVQIRPDFPRALNNLGVAYAETGRHREALDILESADRLKPNDSEIKNNLGVAYRNAGRYQDSIRSYQEALQLNPDDSEVYSNLGDAYYSLGNFPEALESFKQAIRLQPGSELSHYNLGVAYTALGDHQAAIDAYKEALRIKPNYLQARYNLALSYSALGKRELSLDQYRILKDTDKTLSDKLFGLIGDKK